MPVFTANIIIYTGTDFAQTFVLEDAASNSIKDLTGYVGCAQIKRYESSNKSAEFTVGFSNDPTTGRVTIEMLSSVTETLKARKSSSGCWKPNKKPLPSVRLSSSA